MDWLSKALDSLKEFIRSTELAACVALASLILLVLPQSWAPWLSTKNEWGVVVRTVLIIAFVLSSVALVVGLGKSVSQRRKREAALTQVVGRVGSMSVDERMVLAYCLLKNQQNISLPATGPVASSLRAKGFLRITGGNILLGSFIIPDAIWERIVDLPMEAFLGNTPPSDFRNSGVFRNIEQGQYDWREIENL